MLTLTLLAPGAMARSATATPCDLAQIRDADLDDALVRRSVEIISRAGRVGWETDARLKHLVTPTATISIGTNDVVLILEPGVAGSHRLAKTVNADSYRYRDMTYVRVPDTACRLQKITVMFTDTIRKRETKVDFAYVEGRLVSASGQQQPYSEGPMERSEGKD
ncbi:hypothetical protein VPG91_27890 [Nitrospirillum amazonense]|uniref:hypothetical protein n=1 Tax=Nitrospirillum amazonense TaxID=28077 RepID=UPI002DD4330C|nr:hypothetical protein [Nitrospirillum amazonense]MEC4594845.1 hypothetical protein [Nitrospirillum amazonense]